MEKSPENTLLSESHSRVDLEGVLHCRILVARLGEAPNFSWWDRELDVTDIGGGGGFFQKLLPSPSNQIGYLSAVESCIDSAQNHELKRMREANNQEIDFSLFIGSPQLESELNDLFFHWKRFPAEIPLATAKIIDSKLYKNGLIEELESQTKGLPKVKAEGTTFGLKLDSKSKGFNLDKFKLLLNAVELKTAEWSFPYYA